LPSSVSVLPEIEGYDNNVVDAWGNAFLVNIEGENVVTISSLGTDGKPGGTGLASDRTCAFPTKDDAGKWFGDECPWIRNPDESLKR